MRENRSNKTQKEQKTHHKTRGTQKKALGEAEQKQGQHRQRQWVRQQKPRNTQRNALGEADNPTNLRKAQKTHNGNEENAETGIG